MAFETYLHSGICWGNSYTSSRKFRHAIYKEVETVPVFWLKEEARKEMRAKAQMRHRMWAKKHREEWNAYCRKKYHERKEAGNA